MSDGTLQTLDITMLDDVNNASGLIQLDSNAKIPACSGTAITGLSSVTKNASDPAIATNPSGGVGSVWQNTTSGEMFVCTNATAGANVWTNVGAGTGDVQPQIFYGERGVFGGGYGLPRLNRIEYITIATLGNGIDFGDLTVAREPSACGGGGGRGVFFGGDATPSVISNTIDYIMVATTGNAVDFGDLTVGRNSTGACSNGSRGLTGPGSTPTVVNTIDYITIATTGNATDFGDGRTASAQAVLGNATRGLFAGGWPRTVTIDYVTIATTGNTVDFGDLTIASGWKAGTAGVTRGMWIGGNGPATHNVIEYSTIATLGNAIDFGDLRVANEGGSACSNATRAVYAGGFPPVYTDELQYVTMATIGNATDFGDLITAATEHGGLSQ